MYSNKGTLTNIEKLDYFVQWFGEFSPMEKSDFLETYAKKYNDQVEIGNGNLTFGFKKLELNDRLPSIFKCRIQLFEQWFTDDWTDEEKDQLMNRIRNLDCDFVENLDKVIESGKLPSNNLLFASYEISDEMYEELRKNLQLTNGNSLNSISSIDLLNASNGSITNDEITTNGKQNSPLINGNGLLTNGKKDEETKELNSIYQNRHQTNGENGEELNEHSSLEQEEENNEDLINNQISSLGTDNVENGSILNGSNL